MVGERLAELREQKALTLRDLEEASGVGADAISKIENGHRKPRPSTLRKLARALGVEVEDFFREPALPLDEAPREAGLQSVLDFVLDAAQKQEVLEDQAFERAKESKPFVQPIDQRPANDALQDLLERPLGDVAEACVDLALRNIQLERELARAREDNAALQERLQEREQAHS